MTPYYSDESVVLYHGDCIEVMRELPDDSVDAVVTDPPYGLGFMGREWDDLPPGPDFAAECLRVLKPGGHLLAFGGTRTWHRLACAIEDAGFEVRDSIAWMYGSGFPKSLDVSKAMDKRRDDRSDVLRLTSALADLADAAGIGRADVDAHMGTSDMGGWWLSRLEHRCACPSVENWTRLRDFIPGAPELDAEVWRLNGRKGTPGEAWEQREVVGERDVPVGHSFAGETYGGDSSSQRVDITAPATDLARQWQGWGTALKPAFEPIVVARKPLIGTVAENVTRYGTGALNVDGARIGVSQSDLAEMTGRSGKRTSGDLFAGKGDGESWEPTATGRWPANVILDESQAEALDRQSGVVASSGVYSGDGVPRGDGGSGVDFGGGPRPGTMYGDTGGASRFFKVVKEDAAPATSAGTSSSQAPGALDSLDARFIYQPKADSSERPRVDGVAHPTVKSLDLMRYLVRLVTPPGGVVLEPFAGSGTTAEACIVEGFRCIAIEREADYIPLILQRITKPIEVTLL